MQWVATAALAVAAAHRLLVALPGWAGSAGDDEGSGTAAQQAVWGWRAIQGLHLQASSVRILALAIALIRDHVPYHINTKWGLWG